MSGSTACSSNGNGLEQFCGFGYGPVWTQKGLGNGNYGGSKGQGLYGPTGSWGKGDFKGCGKAKGGLSNGKGKGPMDVDGYDSWDEEADKIEHHKMKFWSPEIDCRLRNAAMTPYELHMVKMKVKDNSKLQKVIQHFGTTQCNKAAKDALNVLAEGKGMMPGQSISMYGVEFTLAKSIFLSGIRFDLEHQSVQDRDECYCFPMTSLMPKGCIHHQKALHTVNYWPHSLCATCSKCKRCGGCPD